MKKYLMILLAWTACTPKEGQPTSDRQSATEQPQSIPAEMVGTWKMISMMMYHEDDSSYLTPEEAGVSVVAINKADGSFVDIQNGEEAQGELYLKSDTAILKYDNDSRRMFTYRFSGDTLYYKGKVNGQLMETGFVKKD